MDIEQLPETFLRINKKRLRYTVMASSLSTRVSALIGSRRSFPIVGAFCVLSTLSLSSLSSSSFKSGCSQSFSVVPLLRLAFSSKCRFLIFSVLCFCFSLFNLEIVGLSLAVRLLLHRSKWRRAAKLCPALLFMSLFLTEKQVLCLL